MGWTTPNSRSSGYVVTSTVYDQELIGNLQYLHGDAGTVDLTAGAATYKLTGINYFPTSPGNAVVQVYATNTDTQPAFQLSGAGVQSWGPGGSTAIDIIWKRTAAGVLAMTTGNGIGYGTGTGGTVTQATSLNTGVTINKPTGQITLFTTSTSNGSAFAFTVTNSTVAATDTVIISGSSATNTNMDGFLCSVTSVNSGSFRVSIYTPLAVASATRMLNFAVIKGATS